MRRVLFLICGGLILTTNCGHIAQAQVSKQAQTPQQRAAQRERDASAAALVRLIQSQIPGTDSTWSAAYFPQSEQIRVQSSQTVSMDAPAHFNMPDVKPEQIRRNPSFSLSVEAYISPADYARFKVENTATYAQLNQMAAQMKDIDHKMDSFLPRTPQQKQRVDVYNLLKATVHPLPDFYF